MEDLKLLELMKQGMPNLSRVKPPTESAAQTMIKNLKATAGTNADHSPKNAINVYNFYNKNSG